MAVAERIYTQSYGYIQEERYAYTSYEQAYPERRYKESPEKQKIKRTRSRPQAGEREAAPQGFSGRELRQLITTALGLGILLIGILILNAYAASIQVTINTLTKENITLENEIDALNAQIDGSSSIEQIESYAMDKLNMTYPKSEQCIYIEKDAVLENGFAQKLRENAYKE